LLLQIDVKDPHNALKQLTKMCLVADLTLILAWSCEEAGKLIETYKIFENKPPDLIMEKAEGDDYSRVNIIFNLFLKQHYFKIYFSKLGGKCSYNCSCCK